MDEVPLRDKEEINEDYKGYPGEGPEYDEPEDEIEIVPLPYHWSENSDQALRSFIVEHLGNADIDGRILVENMQFVFEWVREGKVPVKTTKGGPKSPNSKKLELIGDK